jgi:hypothetical protein
MDQGFVQFVRPVVCSYTSYAGRLLSGDVWSVSGLHRGAFGTIRLGTGDFLPWSRFVTSVLWVDSHVVGLAIMLIRQLRSGN